MTYNILIHNHTGEVTHVDFDCIFEKGAKLKIPEIVPFRLTNNMIEAMGPLGFEGIYRKTCEVTLKILRILFCPFWCINRPIYYYFINNYF